MAEFKHSTSTPGSHPLHHQHRRRTPSYSYTRPSLDTRRPAPEVPWEHMTQAFTWVESEDMMKAPRRPRTTQDWVREQQQLASTSTIPSTSRTQTIPSTSRTQTISYTTIRPRTTSTLRRPEWNEEMIYVYEQEADRWIREDEINRRLAMERERTRVRIQDELRRIEARLSEKREAERLEQEMAEKARRRARHDRREKEARDRAKLEKLILDAWADYEKRWGALPTSSEQVDFKSIPWPIIIPPRHTGDISRDAIVGFLFSPLHSQGQSRKDRIRSAQLRWHPDRFRRFLGRVPEASKAEVEEGVGIVARCLNELMEKEKRASSSRRE